MKITDPRVWSEFKVAALRDAMHKAHGGAGLTADCAVCRDLLAEALAAAHEAYDKVVAAVGEAEA